MPIVRVHCLPKQGLDPGLAIRGITSSLADATEIPPNNISVLWCGMAADTYSHGGSLAESQPADSHPVLVDLIAPDFHRAHTIHTMMKVLVREVSALMSIGADNVTVIHYPVGSGQVYDQGRILNW